MQYLQSKGNPAEKGAMRNGEAADPMCGGDQKGEVFGCGEGQHFVCRGGVEENKW